MLNFVEYLLGRDPRFVDDGMEPEITLRPGPVNDRIAVRMPEACYFNGGSKVTWQLEHSDDLVVWNPVPTGPWLPVSPMGIRGDGVVSEAGASLPAAMRRLFRIKFTYTP
jgi:hypothetical protein